MPNLPESLVDKVGEYIGNITTRKELVELLEDNESPDCSVPYEKKVLAYVREGDFIEAKVVSSDTPFTTIT